jgi:hypothetical protein
MNEHTSTNHRELRHLIDGGASDSGCECGIGRRRKSARGHAVCAVDFFEWRILVYVRERRFDLCTLVANNRHHGELKNGLVENFYGLVYEAS